MKRGSNLLHDKNTTPCYLEGWAPLNPRGHSHDSKHSFEDVTSTSKIDSTQRIGEDTHLGVPTGQPFSTVHARGARQMCWASPGKPAAVSPFDLAHGPTTLPAAPTFRHAFGTGEQCAKHNGRRGQLPLRPQLRNLKQSSKYLPK